MCSPWTTFLGFFGDPVFMPKTGQPPQSLKQKSCQQIFEKNMFFYTFPFFFLKGRRLFTVKSFSDVFFFKKYCRYQRWNTEKSKIRKVF